jgi:colicin import membrane protein
MNRLQKKCFIVSAGVHLLLVLILLFGSAFQSAKDKANGLSELEFLPVITFDGPASGGGSPTGGTPPPAHVEAPKPQPPAPAPPPAPKPAPEPEQEVKPQPKKQPEAEPAKEPQVKEVQQSKTDPEAFEPSPKKKKIEISMTQVTRKSDAKAKARAKAEAQAQADAEAVEQATAAANAWRSRATRQIGRMAEHVSDGMSGSTSLELKGPGGGGKPYANFNQAVMSVYKRAWTQQDVAADEDTTVEALVIIARDGTVISGRITRRSGNASVDRSVQATLDRVKYAAPLPENAKEDQREVPITFYARPKQSLG